MILATKVIFKLARDDLNDNIFMSRRTLELLLTSLGNHCPKKDSEAFVYAYGGLKFLTLNADISELLSESLGFLHLSVLTSFSQIQVNFSQDQRGCDEQPEMSRNNILVVYFT